MTTQTHFERLKKAGLPSTEIWRVLCGEKLIGRTIMEVRYLTDEEMESLGWYEKSLVIIFENGEFIFPSADDEGNNAGALFTSWEDLPTMPTIRG
jgi:hypothetical protein